MHLYLVKDDTEDQPQDNDVATDQLHLPSQGHFSRDDLSQRIEELDKAIAILGNLIEGLTKNQEQLMAQRTTLLNQTSRP